MASKFVSGGDPSDRAGLPGRGGGDPGPSRHGWPRDIRSWLRTGGLLALGVIIIVVCATNFEIVEFQLLALTLRAPMVVIIAVSVAIGMGVDRLLVWRQDRRASR